MGSSSQSFNKGRTNAPTPAASHILHKMAYAEPHDNYDRHMENIEVAVEGERDAMEVAEAETRRATNKWRQFSVWLANDSKANELPRGGGAPAGLQKPSLCGGPLRRPVGGVTSIVCSAGGVGLTLGVGRIA